jgi:hypothetical protein
VSAESVPMLLTLALTRIGLDTHVDGGDDISGASCFTAASSEDSHDSSDDDDYQRSRASESNKESTSGAREDTGEHATEHSGQIGDEGSEEISASEQSGEVVRKPVHDRR